MPARIAPLFCWTMEGAAHARVPRESFTSVLREVAEAVPDATVVMIISDPVVYAPQLSSHARNFTSLTVPSQFISDTSLIRGDKLPSAGEPVVFRFDGRYWIDSVVRATVTLSKAGALSIHTKEGQRCRWDVDTLFHRLSERHPARRRPHRPAPSDTCMTTPTHDIGAALDADLDDAALTRT